MGQTNEQFAQAFTNPPAISRSGNCLIGEYTERSVVLLDPQTPLSPDSKLESLRTF
jgi:hypothetical protein